MPYTKSQARKTFDEEIDKMISVIRSTFRNIHSTNDIKEYVLSCSVMLCSAKLETYFEDFFDTWIHKVNALRLTDSHLPKNLRAVPLNQTSINKAFKRLIIENNESAIIDSIISDFSNKNFLLTDDTQVLPVLYSKRIYENKKYPSPENLKTMFKRIGINNIFSELNTSNSFFVI